MTPQDKPQTPKLPKTWGQISSDSSVTGFECGACGYKGTAPVHTCKDGNIIAVDVQEAPQTPTTSDKFIPTHLTDPLLDELEKPIKKMINAQPDTLQDKIKKATLKAIKATNYCTKHGLYHGQKYKSCTPQERVLIEVK